MESWRKDARREPVITDLDALVPKDHLLRKIEKVMDYDWLYERLEPYYILKTECIHRVKIKTFAEARRLIDEYIFFYNHQRIQTKTKLTPMEFRCQYVA